MDWNLPDPMGKGLDAYRVLRDDVEVKVRGLLKELRVPLQALEGRKP